MDFRYATRFRLDDISEQGSKIELKFEEGNVNELTDTDDEEFKKSESLSTSFGVVRYLLLTHSSTDPHTMQFLFLRVLGTKNLVFWCFLGL